MKRLIYLFMFVGILNISAQRENENWVFGNQKWNFNNSFTYNAFPSAMTNQATATISDKSTGELLFYTNGGFVYNKYGAIMQDGDYLFGTPIPNSPFSPLDEFYMNLSFYGNPSPQGVVILPKPGTSSIYYVFSLNGNAKFYHSSTATSKIGLRYAEIDMSYNSGLGKVISKNNIIFTNTNTNVLTTALSFDGTFYWLITQDDVGNYLSYKITSYGINLTPIISNVSRFAASGIKISPNGQKLFDISNRYLYNFNNMTGVISGGQNILSNNPDGLTYKYDGGCPSCAEFSPDSNIVYFISKTSFFCCPPVTGLAMYNINTNQLQGYGNYCMGSSYCFFAGKLGSMQLSEDGRIYISNIDIGVDYVYPQGNSYYFISNPNSWPDLTQLYPPNIVTEIINNSSINAGITFPQLVPKLTAMPCPENLYITNTIGNSDNYQAINSIFASSQINNDLVVRYKAGYNVNLLHGFSVKASEGSLFQAYINRCDILPNSAKTTSKGFNNDNEKIKNKHTTVYPNPSSTYITIETGNEQLVLWELLDLSGKIILKGSSTTVDVQNVPKSTYLLKITTDKNSVTKKVLVN